MKVYTAHREYDYEGFEIIGVFTTKEAADECCANDVHKDGYQKGQPRGDSHDTGEHELRD